MKIKFNSDDSLPLKEAIEISSMVIVFRAVFHENDKHYPQSIILINIKVLYFDRIHVSEGIDFNKTSASKVWYLSLLVFFK